MYIWCFGVYKADVCCFLSFFHSSDFFFYLNFFDFRRYFVFFFAFFLLPFDVLVVPPGTKAYTQLTPAQKKIRRKKRTFEN